MDVGPYRRNTYIRHTPNPLVSLTLTIAHMPPCLRHATPRSKAAQDLHVSGTPRCPSEACVHTHVWDSAGRRAPLKYHSSGHGGATAFLHALFVVPCRSKPARKHAVLEHVSCAVASCTKAFKRRSPRTLPKLYLLSGTHWHSVPGILFV